MISLLALAAGLDDDVAIRQPRLHTYAAAFGMMPVPAVMMTLIEMFADDNIVAIADDNFCGCRADAHKQRSNGRT